MAPKGPIVQAAAPNHHDVIVEQQEEAAAAPDHSSGNVTSVSCRTSVTRSTEIPSAVSCSSFEVAAASEEVASCAADADLITCGHRRVASERHRRPGPASHDSQRACSHLSIFRRPSQLTASILNQFNRSTKDLDAPLLYLGGSGMNADLPFWSQEQFDCKYDLVQKIGQGWSSQVFLVEHRATRAEVALKALDVQNVSTDDFLTEFRHGLMLCSHSHILKMHQVAFRMDTCYMFEMEHAALGDLTSNLGDRGIGESATSRVAEQIGSALEWMHSKNLCHLDVKLNNILVFQSDFALVKLCDFGSVRSQGDIVIKKNELLFYCPPELMAKRANHYYQVHSAQDVFQFGVVIFFCLFGILPWQRADDTDPNFAEFLSWRRKWTGKVPKNFKPMSSKSQKLFHKLLDPDPTKRLRLAELPKYSTDKWLKAKAADQWGLKKPCNIMDTSTASWKLLSDGISQLTMGSFQSVHSNAGEKNLMLSTLLEHGVETTIDRSEKNSRILNWICQSQNSDAQSDPHSDS